MVNLKNFGYIMLKLNKKCLISGLLSLAGIIFLLVAFNPAKAASTKAYQVKVKNSPTVYFLNYASHHKKAYLNATSYLSYPNNWSDIKIISAAELAAWPDIKLMRTGSTPSIYYVKGNMRAKLNNRDDLESFGFLGEPVLNVSETDLNQYRLVSYFEIGLTSEPSATDSNSSNNTPAAANSNNSNSAANSAAPVVVAGNLLAFSDPVIVTGNTLAANTNNNLMGIFRFQATQNTATITALTFHFGGVYGNDLLKQAYVRDENNKNYDTNNNLRTNDRELIVTFKEPLTINPGEEKTVKISLDFNSGEYNNQTIQLQINQVSDITTNLMPALGSASAWPLSGTLFKLMSANNLIGSLTIQKESLVGVSNTNSGILMGKFTLSEISGNEDAVIKKIVFQNAGSAHNNDITNFSLSNNGQVIARAAGFDSDGSLTFNLSYLRVSKASYTTLTLNGDLVANYNKLATVDFQTLDLSGTGVTYNFSLPIKITNLNEAFALN